MASPRVTRLREVLVRALARKREHARSERPKRAMRILGRIAIGFLVLVVLGLVVGIVVLALFLKDLPSAEDLAMVRFDQSTRILDREGKLLYEIHGDQRRTIVALGAMGRVPDAVIAAEDDSFYSHPGFDVNGLIRAGFNCVRGAFRGTGCSGGGSTITQQFVKNTYLSSEKTFSRKAKELVLSMEVEQRFTKDEILALYLNVVGFGSNAYGIESAARMYFGKPARDLTLDESALLAGMLQSPSRYSPWGQHTDLLLGRKAYVLKRMRDLGMIDEEEQAAALAMKTLGKLKQTREQIRAPHFVFYVRDQLEQKYGRELVERGGLTVTTSLDPVIQDLAEQATVELIAKRGKADKVTNSALVMLDPKTGQVLAMAGSKGYFADDIDGKVNVTTSRRQPGSSFKPFIYANFFRMGFGPGSVLWDTETDFGRDYVPKNYSGTFSGPVTVRRALGGSLNLPAIKALYVAGLDDTVTFVADTFGFDSIRETPRENIGLSFAIGAVEVTPLELAQGFQVFATGGSLHRATGIVKISDANGETLEEVAASDAGAQVLDPQVAYLVDSVLSDCGARPAGWGALCYEPKHTVGAKTGTSNRKIGNTYLPSDLWTAVYTPSVVAVMWAGNNDGSVTAARADGLNTVAPIMKTFLTAVFDKKKIPDEDFAKPSGITTMALSNLSGLPGSDVGSHTDIISSFGKEFLSKFRASPVVSAKVDESCGPALATEFSPPAMVKTWVYAGTHDIVYYIRPNDPLLPALERTVRGYAGLAAGDGSNVVFVDSPSKIPTEPCTRYTSQSVPQITLVSPFAGELTVGPNTITVQITSLNPIATVTFAQDGTVFATQNACTTCSATLTVPESQTGSEHQLSITVVDDVGFQNTYTVPVRVSTARDTQPPSVRLNEPEDGLTVVAGSTVSISATATDAGSVSMVEFAYNRSVFATIRSAPYAATFEVPSTAEGRHEITAIATDDAGNIGTSSSFINVIAGTPPPSSTP